MPIIISIFACIATLLGGFFALKFRDKLHLILGFSAGAVIAVAFFDLMPEAIELGSKSYTVATMVSIVALGFFVYMILDRCILFHSHTHEHDDHDHDSANLQKGKLGASSLSIHSFLDGVAIGLAFKVSISVGIIVAIAVLVHDFSDGINTVSLVLKNKGDRKQALKWLIVDALAPVIGVMTTLFFTLPQNILGIVLAIFSGFFLYIGASDLLPESHHSHPTAWTTLATLLGVIVLFVAIKLASI